MKLRKLRSNEKNLIDNIIIKFGSDYSVKEQNLFSDDFGRVYLYTGRYVDMHAYALGLNIGKISDVFSPTLDFLHLIKPAKNTFSISKDEALKFMAGHDLTLEKLGEIPENIEDGTYFAVKFNDLIIGPGKYTDKIIKNKLPKDRKIRITAQAKFEQGKASEIMQKQEKENEED